MVRSAVPLADIDHHSNCDFSAHRRRVRAHSPWSGGVELPQGPRGESSQGVDAVLWTFAAAGGIGLLLGFWFRVPAMIAVSGLAAACMPATLTNPDPTSTLLTTVALLCVLQAGYLAGLMLAPAWSRVSASFPAPQWGAAARVSPTRGSRVKNRNLNGTGLAERGEKSSLGSSC
jgi:hypothetical protein